MFSRVVVAATGASPVRKAITKTKPGLALAKKFVAGDTLQEAVAVGHALNRRGFLLSLDLLGEEVHDRESAEGALREYLECLDRIGSEGLNSNISVKLTQLGLSIDEGLAREAIGRLAVRAGEVGTTLTIDMEDSRFTTQTVDIYAEAQAQHRNLGLAIQSYLKRTPADLERLIPLGGHIRLCKGAYVEPSEVALTVKSAVDGAYKAQLKTLMMSEITKPAIATHDSDLVDLARSLAPQRINEFEFQMLYGVRTSLQEELVQAGFPLRIYLPFGSQWYPYLTRRMAERPANVWFFARAVFGG
jgi:proline dehydrogenase